MAVANVLSRHTFALGPAKMEVIVLENPDNNDEAETRIQRPMYALAAAASNTSSMINYYVEISGKTLTIKNADGSSDLMIIVIGY